VQLIPALTNAQFARFVAQTGYVTLAERPLDPALYPGALPELLVPGGLVFTKPPGRCAWVFRRTISFFISVPLISGRSPTGTARAQSF
jgi:sulfatase modifying factor 1